ncbi:MAG: hypothetical protein KDD40_07225 [Bdellovibrionales bacterium]|nr:hypothetical protein [Bdellovibrionales bacterium]
MVIVKEVNWFDENKYDADVIITDGKIEIPTFCSPCHYKVGDEVKDVGILDYIDIEKLETEPVNIENPVYKPSTKTYLVKGQIVNYKKKGSMGNDVDLKIGNIIIDFGRIPGDIQDGDWVLVEISRFDLI